MAKKMEQMKVAILATDGFEQSELLEPKKALDQAEVETEIIAPKSGTIRGWNKKEWGDEVLVTKSLEQADAEEYDALVLPGGVMNPDHLRMNPKAVEFVKSFGMGSSSSAVSPTISRPSTRLFWTRSRLRRRARRREAPPSTCQAVLSCCAAFERPCMPEMPAAPGPQSAILKIGEERNAQPPG